MIEKRPEKSEMTKLTNSVPKNTTTAISTLYGRGCKPACSGKENVSSDSS